MASGSSYKHANQGQFSKAEISHLLDFLAEVNPEKKGRSGNAIYKRLVENPDVWPWGRSRTWQAWRQYYVKNEQMCNLKIEKLLENKGMGKRNDEQVGESSSQIPSSQNQNVGNRGNEPAVSSVKHRVNANWMDEERNVSRGEDLPQQRSKAVQSNEDTARPKPSPKRVNGRRTADVLVPSSQTRPREPTTEDVEYPRSETREQRPDSSLQGPSTTTNRRKAREYNTPSPSRSLSVEDRIANNIEVDAPRISNPRERDHPSPTIDEIAEEQLDDDEEMFRQEVILKPPSGGDMSRPLAEEEIGSQEDEVEEEEHSRDAMQSQHPVGTMSSYLEPPSPGQRMVQSSLSTTQPDTSISTPSVSQVHQRGTTSAPLVQEDDEETGAPPPSQLAGIFIDDEDTPLEGFGLTQLRLESASAEVEPRSTALTTRPTRTAQLGQETELNAGDSTTPPPLMILPETSKETRKRKRSSYGNRNGIGDEIEGSNKRVKGAFLNLDIMEEYPREDRKGKGRAVPQQLHSAQPSGLNVAPRYSSVSHAEGNHSHSAGQASNRHLVRAIDGHRRRHTVGGETLIHQQPDKDHIPRISSVGPIGTSTPHVRRDHHRSSSTHSYGSLRSASPADPSISSHSPSERVALSYIDPASISDADISVLALAGIRSLAKSHGFSRKTVFALWRSTGDLEKTDKILKQMGAAAKQVMERETSVAAISRRSSRALSTDGSLYEQAVSHQSMGKRLLGHVPRKSSLSRILVADSEDDSEAEDDNIHRGSSRALHARSPNTADGGHQRDDQVQSNEEDHEGHKDEISATRKHLTFHVSPARKRSPDMLKIRRSKESEWTEAENAIIVRSDPVELRKLVKARGANGAMEVRRRTIELLGHNLG